MSAQAETCVPRLSLKQPHKSMLIWEKKYVNISNVSFSVTNHCLVTTDSEGKTRDERARRKCVQARIFPGDEGDGCGLILDADKAG